ncbi:MAG: ROK family protein [Anaeromassilibacillus sp.]
MVPQQRIRHPQYDLCAGGPEHQCGIITDGKRSWGSAGSGEFGHNTINYRGALCECGNRGCLEKYCSFLVFCENITRRLQAGEPSILSENNLTAASISDAVKTGDKVAREEYEKACEFLSIGIVNLINQFNPGMIVIGDELAEVAPDLLLKIVCDKVHACINPLVYNDITIEVNRLPESPALWYGYCSTKRFPIRPADEAREEA